MTIVCFDHIVENQSELFGREIVHHRFVVWRVRFLSKNCFFAFCRMSEMRRMSERRRSRKDSTLLFSSPNGHHNHASAPFWSSPTIGTSRPPSLVVHSAVHVRRTPDNGAWKKHSVFQAPLSGVLRTRTRLSSFGTAGRVSNSGRKSREKGKSVRLYTSSLVSTVIWSRSWTPFYGINWDEGRRCITQTIF